MIYWYLLIGYTTWSAWKNSRSTWHEVPGRKKVQWMRKRKRSRFRSWHQWGLPMGQAQITVLINVGFQFIGGTPSYHPFYLRIFHDKPSSYWGTLNLGNTQIWWWRPMGVWMPCFQTNPAFLPWNRWGSMESVLCSMRIIFNLPIGKMSAVQI